MCYRKKYKNKDNPSLRVAEIKKAIAKYGAVTFQYNNLHNIYYYNPKNEKSGSSYPHACTIIGWDDLDASDSLAPIVMNETLYFLTQDGKLVAYR